MHLSHEVVFHVHVRVATPFVPLLVRQTVYALKEAQCSSLGGRAVPAPACGVEQQPVHEITILSYLFADRSLPSRFAILILFKHIKLRALGKTTDLQLLISCSQCVV